MFSKLSEKLIVAKEHFWKAKSPIEVTLSPKITSALQSKLFIRLVLEE